MILKEKERMKIMSGRKENHSRLKAVLIVLMLALIAGSGLMIKLCLDLADREFTVESTKADQPIVLETKPAETEPSAETTAPQPEHVVTTATLGAMGDLLMHKPIFDDHEKYNAAVQQADGSYDFSTVFQYIAEPVSRLDYAAVNLETTLASNDNGYGYSGYPLFNCPDSIADFVKETGFDMMLTANNHSYDTSMVGLRRTLEVVRSTGLETLGTYLSADETKWTVQEINGIRIGMLCYTYATGVAEKGRPSLNNNQAIAEAGLCNYFYTGDLDSFYTEISGYLREMEDAGAEAAVLFIHWGVEYILEENQTQNAMAQKLCDLGVDVIIGGHPHVVQPVELLTSTADPEHKTVCLYSMGNAVSNQRLGFSQAITTPHTEDGILFSVTFEKYSDGTVYLAEASAMPTWVNKFRNANGKDEYNILPLEDSDREEWQTMFSLSDSTLTSAQNSYDRTMAIVGDGLAEVNEYLTAQKIAREENYLRQLEAA